MPDLEPIPQMKRGETSGETQPFRPFVTVPEVVEKLTDGRLVPLQFRLIGRLPPGTIVLVPPRAAEEHQRQLMDRLASHELTPADRITSPTRLWREALNTDARSPDAVSRFRRRSGLAQVTAADLTRFKYFVRSLNKGDRSLNFNALDADEREKGERLVRAELRSGGSSVEKRRKLGGHIRAIRGGGIGLVFAAFWEDFAAPAGEPVPVATCRFCGSPFAPKGSVTDCCAREECRKRREAVRKRLAYHAEPEARDRAKTRVRRARQRKMRASSRGLPGPRDAS